MGRLLTSEYNSVMKCSVLDAILCPDTCGVMKKWYRWLLIVQKTWIISTAILGDPLCRVFVCMTFRSILNCVCPAVRSPVCGLWSFASCFMVPAGSPSRGGNVTVNVKDINQPSLPTPFYFVLVSICVFMALSTVLVLYSTVLVLSSPRADLHVVGMLRLMFLT